MKLQLTDAEVNHLRRLLAWMRVEYCLDENMQRGSLEAIKMFLDRGEISQEEANMDIAERADKIKQVPKYFRQAIKMLTKAVNDHDGAKGDIVDAPSRTVRHIETEGE